MSLVQDAPVYLTRPSRINIPAVGQRRIFASDGTEGLTLNSYYEKRSDNSVVLLFTPGGGGGGSGWLLDGNTNGAEKYIGTNDAFDFPIYTNGVERGRIDVVGLWGINSATVAGTQLFVKGTGNTSATWVAQFVNSDGNVMLGIRNDYHLEAGDGDGNLSIGYQSGPTIPGLIHNIAIGYHTLRNLTTGERNTILGAVSCDQLTTGMLNTAVGDEAMEFLNTGDNNTAVGGLCMQNITSGARNTAVGHAALSNITTQIENTAVGRDALKIAVSSSNDAFGFSALSALTTGVNNVAVGQVSLALSVSGNRNTSVGAAAGFNCKGSGSDNVYVGHQAGYGNFVGAQGGSKNVMIGASAGEANTGDSNVIIGYHCAQSSVAFDGQSNIFVVHNDNSDNPLLFGDFTNRNLGINTIAFGTNAKNVFGLSNGSTEVSTAIANGIQIYSVDSDDTTATLGLFLEQAVEAVGTFTGSNKIKVKINGALYWIELDAV